MLTDEDKYQYALIQQRVKNKRKEVAKEFNKANETGDIKVYEKEFNELGVLNNQLADWRKRVEGDSKVNNRKYR